MTNPHSLEDLVRAICQGKTIDWESLERDASPGFHNKLAALRVVESIARVHRTAIPEGTMPSDDAASGTSAAPERWGHLELLEHLASGAFGDVYRAWDSGLDREVALKLLRRSLDADAHADEALEEGRLLAKVRHANVVTVHGAARFDGRAGIWMDFVRGRTLADVVAQDGPLPPAQVASIGVALCHALSAVHAASLVHRDVKPQNVMMGDDGRIVLMDFGAGGAVRHAGLQHAGTPLYLAPEVAAGGPATVQSDIYSLGATLRVVLTGNARSQRDLRSSDRTERRLLAILAKATAARPSERFESSEALAAALLKFTGPRRNLGPMYVGAALAVVLLVLIWATSRTANLEDSGRRALEKSWQAAIPALAPLTPDQAQLIAGVQGTFSFHGILAGTTGGAGGHESLLTFDPRSGDTQPWLSYSFSTGHPESPTVSPDGSLVAYVWVDVACRCSSLRTVDRSGRVRTLLADPDIVTIWIGATASRLLPIVSSDKSMHFELAVIDIDSGVRRVLRKLPVDPSGFSLSPDGRFVAFDVPSRLEPGAPHDIIVQDTSTSREWPLIDTPADRIFPVWSPRGDALLYLEYSKDKTVLKGVKLSNGHQASPPALLRRDFDRPGGIGFLDDETFAYWMGTGRSDVLTVEAASNGKFHGQKSRRLGPGSMMPAWSPDARWLAWSDFAPRTGGIQVTDSNGRVIRTFRPSLDVQVYPTWSDDSRELAFWDVSRNGGILKVVDIEKGTAREVLRWSHPQIEGAFDLSWLPGGRELLINIGNAHTATLDTISGSLRDICKQTAELGFISPDRRWRAYCEGMTPSPIHVVPLNSDGEPITLHVSTFPSEALIGWWPDGSLLEVRGATDSNLSSQDELWRRPLNGEPAEWLGITGTNIIYVSVASDGKHVAYGTQTFGQELLTLKPVRPQ